MAEDLQLRITADIGELEAQYGKIKKLEEDRAAEAQILTQQTLTLRKKALAEEEAALRRIIQAQEEAGASNKEQFQKPIEESTRKIQQLKGEVDKLTPATQNVTKAQEQLAKGIKRVEQTLRGFAVTAAIAFGAAILKGVIDFAKGLFEASAATQAINAAMKEFTEQAGKALGSMKEQFNEIRKLTPGTQAWKNEIEKVNKQYGNMIKLEVDATLAEIEEAERRLTVGIREQVEERVRREALAKAFGDAESARLAAEIAQRKGTAAEIIETTARLRDLEEAAKDVEAALEPKEFERRLQAATAARIAAEEAQLKLHEKVDARQKKLEEERKQAAQKAAQDILANFDQAEKAIQGLQDEIEKAEIERIENDRDRARALAQFEFDVAKRNAEDTIKNEEQRNKQIELLRQKHILALIAIEREGQDDEVRARIPLFEKTKENLDDLEKKQTNYYANLIKQGKESAEIQARSEEQEFERRVARFEASIDAVNSLGQAFRSLSQIVGEETEAGAKLSKVAALFDIAASQAVAIANAVQIAGNVGKALGPAGPIGFAATLAALLATTITNIANAKQLIEGAELPRFAEGTSASEKGPAIVGERGPEIVVLPKGAAVFNNQASKTQREMIDAINDGTINDLIMRQYVYPAIMAHQVAQKVRDKQELKDSMQDMILNAFDDTNLVRIGERQRDLLKVIASRLKTKPTPAPRSRF